MKVEEIIVDNRVEWRKKYEHHIAIKNCKHENYYFTHTGLIWCKFCKKPLGEYKGNGRYNWWRK